MSSSVASTMRVLALLILILGLVTAGVVVSEVEGSYATAAQYLLVVAQTLGIYLFSAVGLWVGAEIVTALRRAAPGGAPLAATALQGPAPAAEFAPCPNCGKVVNRQAGRCPYCQTDLP